MSHVFQKLFSPVVVAAFDQVLHEDNVCFTTFKIPTAAQHQRLIDTIFEMSVGGFDVTVFVGTSGIRAFGFAFVVTHERRIAFGQFFAAGVISYGCGQ